MTDQDKTRLLNDLKAGMSVKDAAEKYDLNRRTVGRYYVPEAQKLVDKDSDADISNLQTLANEMKDVSFTKMTDELSSCRPTDELIELLKTESKRKIDSANSKKNVDIKINIDGPIGLSFFGDPHIDNEGCDWNVLHNDVQTVKNTEGMFAGNVGDQTDNWVGRLAKLFQHQKITRPEALQLVEWLFKEIPWLFVINGNHDHWNADTGNVLDYIFRLAEVPGLNVEHDARIFLNFPNGNVASVRARHNFSGRSQFNPVHGMVKETQLNLKDDILVCGDWHHTGYQPIWYNEGGKGFANGGPILCHAIRVGTYKVYDSFAVECGFKYENWAPNIVAIVDPYATDPKDKVKIEFSTEAGADRLTWMRNKWKGNNTHHIKSK